MVKALYVLKASPGSSKDLVDLLNVISGRTGYQVGCEKSQVWHNRQTSEIMLFESWRSIEDLMVHINSKLFKRLLAAMEMSSSEPLVTYMECENVRGMDLIEEVILSKDGRTISNI